MGRLDRAAYFVEGCDGECRLRQIRKSLSMAEYGKVDSFRRQPSDTQSVLLQLNIADDYFKAKKQISLLEEEIQSKEKELYDLKHELIASQIKLENTEKNVKSLQSEVNAKKIIRMETELKDLKGNGK